MAEVVINARAAARPRITGVGRWARELAARLPELRPGAYVVARPPAALAHRAGIPWEQGVLPLRAASARARLVLSPANAAPLAWPRNVVVLHDAAALRHPEWYSRAYATWHRAMLTRLARRARAVITVSSHSRDELLAALPLSPDGVHVVAGGVDELFSPGADPGLARRRLGLERPYVLTLGGAHARKNLAALAPAARRLASEGVELINAGATRSHLAREPAGGLRDVGYVDDELLPGLYAGATAFVLPSRHEGFGLPCLEAMASGVPVVAADRGALPETCGGAALLVDPDDPDALSQALLTAVDDEAARARLREAGLVRASELTWARTAEGVDAVLAELARD